MRRLPPLFALLMICGCTVPGAGPEPSLAPRAAEAIDPRVPIPDTVQSGPADPALTQRLQALVGQAQAAVAGFETREAEAVRLAADAGPSASEGWVAAQLALSRLIEQHGVTTRAAADIDELASTRLDAQRWITPADQRAIAGAAAEVAAISDAQTAAIKRLQDQLAR